MINNLDALIKYDPRFLSNIFLKAGADSITEAKADDGGADEY